MTDEARHLPVHPHITVSWMSFPRHVRLMCLEKQREHETENELKIGLFCYFLILVFKAIVL